MAFHQIRRVVSILHGQALLKNSQPRSAVSWCTGDVDPVTWFCARAFERPTEGHIAMDRQRHRQRPGSSVTANQLHIVVVQLFKQRIAKGFKPGFIDLGQRQGQR